MDRKQRINELVWQRFASAQRTKLRAELSDLLGDFEFLSEDESMNFGAGFWSKARSLKSEDGLQITEILLQMGGILSESEVVWLHHFTSETGAIRVKASRLLPCVESVAARFGPDILLGTSDLGVGFVLDVGEHGEILSFWGVEP